MVPLGGLEQSHLWDREGKVVRLESLVRGLLWAHEESWVPLDRWELMAFLA